MGWGTVLALVAVAVCSPPRAAVAAAGDGLPPALSPIINALCDEVECGRGTCKVNTNHTFGFVCECDQGWTKPHLGDRFMFLPCVIPNCTLDLSCFHHAPASAPAPPPLLSPPSNRSLFDPCRWSYCGEGTCMRTSSLRHRCNCNPGFGNLLNLTSFPCFRECVIGMDCARLGIWLPNGNGSSSLSPMLPNGNGSSSLSPTSQPNQTSPGHAPNRGTTKFPESFLWLSLLMISLVIISRI